MAPGTIFFRKALALLVHVYTASGILTGFLALMAIQTQDWRLAMLWLLLGLFIDGTDGMLARALSVKQYAPQFDGKAIDTVVDFVNYAFVPACLVYAAELVPAEAGLFTACMILLISALYYGKLGMVTQDFHFRGFPVLWNMAALYLIFVWDFEPWLNFVFLLALGILHFVPIKFVYPSQAPFWRPASLAVTSLFLLSNVVLVYQYPAYSPGWALVSSLCVAYYFAVSLYATFRSVPSAGPPSESP